MSLCPTRCASYSPSFLRSGALQPIPWFHDHSAGCHAISHCKFCHPSSSKYPCLFEGHASTLPHILNCQAISSFQNRVSGRFSTYRCIIGRLVPLFSPCLHVDHSSIGHWTSFHQARSSRLCRYADRFPRPLCTYFYLSRHTSRNRCACWTSTRLRSRHLRAISLLHGLDARQIRSCLRMWPHFWKP